MEDGNNKFWEDNSGVEEVQKEESTLSISSSFDDPPTPLGTTAPKVDLSSEDSEDEYEYEEDGSDYGDSFEGFFSLTSWVRDAWQYVNRKKLFGSALVLGTTISTFFIVSGLFLFSFWKSFGGLSVYLSKAFPQLSTLFFAIDNNIAGGSNVFMGSLLFLMTVTLGITCLGLVEKFLDDHWGVVLKQNIYQKFATYWIILSVVPFSFVTSSGLSIFLKASGKSTWATGVGIGMTQVLVSFFCFGLIYKVISKSVLSWKSSFYSSIIATLAFEVSKYIFFGLINSTYSLPLVPALVFSLSLFTIFWTFNSFTFIYAGYTGHVMECHDLYAEEEDMLKYPSRFRPTREIALICLLELTNRFYDHSKNKNKTLVGMDPNELAFFTKTTPARAKAVLGHLARVGLIEILTDHNRQIAVLKYSPDKLTLEEFLSRVEERLGEINLPPINFSSNIFFWDIYKDVLESKFGELTFKELWSKTATFTPEGDAKEEAA